MRFHFDPRKSTQLRNNPRRGIGFEEAQQVFARPYYLDVRSDLPEQFRMACNFAAPITCRRNASTNG